jgi:hypothetical protein
MDAEEGTIIGNTEGEVVAVLEVVVGTIIDLIKIRANPRKFMPMFKNRGPPWTSHGKTSYR